MKPAFRTLLESAILAPSGDNTQPWRFRIDEAGGRIDILLDPTRDPSPMNAGQRMARIGIGAALENMLQTAEHNHWPVELEEPAPPALVRLRLLEGHKSPGTIEQHIQQRVTNRRVYDLQPISEEILVRLMDQTPELHGVQTHWITDRQQLDSLARVIGQTDLLMFGRPDMRRAFLDNIRFDLPVNAPANEGLPLASLEVTAADRFALRLLPRIPNWMLHRSGALKNFSKKAEQLVRSASGLCIVLAPDKSEQMDLNVGRAMERAWLAITKAGLAAQPMMSVPVLANALDHAAPDVAGSSWGQQVAAALRQFQSLLPGYVLGRTACILRFGHAPAPSGRAGRLPMEAFVNAS